MHRPLAFYAQIAAYKWGSRYKSKSIRKCDKSCPNVTRRDTFWIRYGGLVGCFLCCVFMSMNHYAHLFVDFQAMARCGKFLKPSKAYHFLEGPYVEYEGVLDADEKTTLLGKLQQAFADLVEEDIPTEIALLSADQADEICNRQAQNFDMEVFKDPRTQQIRVVTVAGFPCPCGGTHVRSTAALRERQWGVTKIQAKKGVVRVKYGQNTQK